MQVEIIKSSDILFPNFVQQLSSVVFYEKISVNIHLFDN